MKVLDVTVGFKLEIYQHQSVGRMVGDLIKPTKVILAIIAGIDIKKSLYMALKWDSRIKTTLRAEYKNMRLDRKQFLN